MTLASDNKFPKLIITEGTAPASPAAGDQKLFIDSADHLLKLKNSAGAVSAVGGGLSDPMTTRGDIIVRNASNVTARLAIGANGTFLKSDGTDVSWATPAGGAGFSGAKVYRNATQSLSGTSTTALLFDTEDYDTDSYHSTVSNTSRLTVPSTGYYHFTAHIWMSTAVGGDYMFRVDGTTTYSATRVANATGEGWTFSADFSLTASQYVEVVAQHDASTTLGHASARSAQIEFSVFRIGS